MVHVSKNDMLCNFQHSIKSHSITRIIINTNSIIERWRTLNKPPWLRRLHAGLCFFSPLFPSVIIQCLIFFSLFTFQISFKFRFHYLCFCLDLRFVWIWLDLNPNRITFYWLIIVSINNRVIVNRPLSVICGICI